MAGKYTKDLDPAPSIDGASIMGVSEETTEELYKTTINNLTQNFETANFTNAGGTSSAGTLSSGGPPEELVLSSSVDYDAITLGSALNIGGDIAHVENKTSPNKVIVHPGDLGPYTNATFTYTLPYIGNINSTGVADSYINTELTGIKTDVLIRGTETLEGSLDVIGGDITGDGDLTISGTSTANSVVATINVSTNNVNTTTLSAASSVSASSVNATTMNATSTVTANTVNTTNVNATSTVAADTISSTMGSVGTFSAGTISSSGTVSAANLAATSLVSSSDINATDSINCTTANTDELRADSIRMAEVYAKGVGEADQIRFLNQSKATEMFRVTNVGTIQTPYNEAFSVKGSNSTYSLPSLVTIPFDTTVVSLNSCWVGSPSYHFIPKGPANTEYSYVGLYFFSVFLLMNTTTSLNSSERVGVRIKTDAGTIIGRDLVHAYAAVSGVALCLNTTGLIPLSSGANVSVEATTTSSGVILDLTHSYFNGFRVA